MRLEGIAENEKDVEILQRLVNEFWEDCFFIPLALLNWRKGLLKQNSPSRQSRGC